MPSRVKLRHTLVAKAATLVALVALLPFIAATVLLFRSARTALYSEIVRGLDVRVALMRDVLAARVSELRANAIAWASLDVMNDLLADDVDKRVTVVLEGLKRDYGIDGDIYALDTTGRIVASSAPLSIGRSLPALEGALARVTITDVRASAIDQLPVVALSVPIRVRAVEGRAIGILRLEVHARDLARALLDGAVPLAAVIRSDGSTVAASPAWPATLNDSSAPESLRYLVAIARQRPSGEVPDFGWRIMGAVDREAALAPIVQVERRAIVAGVAGIAFLALLVAVTTARTIRPLTGVARAAERIARTMDLSLRVPAKGRDEVGQVARAFNRMVDEVHAHVGKLTEANIEMLEVLGSAIAKRDSDTSAHNYRVTLMALALAERYGLGRDALRSLMKGSFLHDVGKIAISDTILLKPGRLDAAEFATMKTHVLHGADIVQRYGWLSDAVSIVRHHHERYDGSGYPDGLAGTTIPLAARIFAIADVFDALTCERPYKAAMTLDMALETMAAGRGQHFDPDLFDRFRAMAPQMYRDICRGASSELTHEVQVRMRRYFYELEGVSGAGHDEQHAKVDVDAAPADVADGAVHLPDERFHRVL